VTAVSICSTISALQTWSQPVTKENIHAQGHVKGTPWLTPTDGGTA
jgi:hypothetical protein